MLLRTVRTVSTAYFTARLFRRRVPQSRIVINIVLIVAKAVVLHQRQGVALLAELDTRFEQIRPWQFTESLMSLPVAGQFAGNSDC